MWIDFVNSIFEAAGGIFIALSCFKLYKDKMIRGVSWISMSFFMTWGYWNLYYYTSLNQMFSLIGGVGATVANTIYVFMMVYYIKKERA